MSSEILVAVFSFVGTLIGWVSSASLVNWRIAQLEKKVDKHNQLVEWKYNAESRLSACEEKLRDVK